jgi:Domain of unknown function (DUF4936)
MSIDAPTSELSGGLTSELRRWFIYYRIQPEDSVAVIAAVRQFQSELRQRCPGLTAELFRRTPEASGLLTLMEIYALPDALPSPDVPAQDWPACIEAAASVIRPWLQGERHLETFVPCA